MIRVAAPSRLHFGMMGALAGAAGSSLRRFGSVGLMIDSPGIHLRAEPATSWSADGPLAERALAFARGFTQTPPPAGAPGGPRPARLHVEQAVPEHAGLGSGTQLALAVARALSLLWEWPALDVSDLARRVGRGRRSGLGVHGFAHGGFLVDGGKGTTDALAPLLIHSAFPELWRVVVAVPPGASGLHGPGEHQAFAELAGRQADLARTDALCRLVLLGMLPALAERDLDGFGAAVHEFNARVGEAFAPVQKGIYASPLVAEVVDFVRRQGEPGVGQSSWGPAVFALVGDEERAADLARRLGERFGLQAPGQVLVTRASACGATWER